jgi:hypothetical protein
MTEHIFYGQRPERHLHPFIGLVIDLDRERMARLSAESSLCSLRAEYGILNKFYVAAVEEMDDRAEELHEAQAMICTLTVRDEAQRGTIAELRAALSLSDRLVAELVAQKAELGETHARLAERAIQFERRARVVAAVPAARPGRKAKP